MTSDLTHCVTGAQLDLRGDNNTLGVILCSSTAKGLRRSSGSALKVPASSHLVHLLCNDRRIRLRHRLASHGLIVESAVMLVRVAMACTEGVIAATLEAGKPHSFIARETSVCVNLFWSGLASPVDLRGCHVGGVSALELVCLLSCGSSSSIFLRHQSRICFRFPNLTGFAQSGLRFG